MTSMSNAGSTRVTSQLALRVSAFLRSSSAFWAVIVACCISAGCRVPLREPDALDRIDPADRVRFPVPAEVVHALGPSPAACERVDLTVRVDPTREWIEGEARLEMRSRTERLDEVTLDFGPLEVVSIDDGMGFHLAYTALLEEERLRVALAPARTLDEPFALVVRYRGRPAWGMHFLHDGESRYVVTHGQPAENHHWFPCLERPDERTVFSLSVEVPEGYATVAAGSLVESASMEGGWRRDVRRFEFAQPAYLVSLAIGPFVSQTVGTGDASVVVHSSPSEREAAGLSFAEAGDVLAFFRDWLAAPLPFEKLSHTVVPSLPAGAMENTGSIFYVRDRVLQHASVGTLHDPLDIVAHETAHQWFGDLMSPASWADVWISEGFASYLHLLYVERVRGREAFRRWMRFNRVDAMRADQGEARRPIVWGSYREASELFDGHAYGGAAWRLHMLRERFGDEVFQRALQLLLERGRGRSVDTPFVQHTLSEAFGVDLEPFFATWFYDAGHPELDVSHAYDAGRSTWTVDVRQVQGRRRWTRVVYATPLKVRVTAADGRSREFDLQLEHRVHRFAFALDFEPAWVRVDPDDVLYATFRVEQPTSAWRAQFTEDPDPFGRADAAEHLAHLMPSAADDLREELATLLANRLRDDPSWIVREVVAKQLGDQPVDSAREALLVAALYDVRDEVRLAACEALGAHDPTAVVATLRQVLQAEPNPLVRAAALRSVGRARVPGATPLVREGLAAHERPDAPLLRAAALDALAELVDPGSPDGDRLLELVLPFLDREREPEARVRARAVLTYERMTRRRVESRRVIEGMLEDPDVRVRSACVAALGERLDPASLRGLIAAWRREREPRLAVAMMEVGKRINQRVERTVAELSWANRASRVQPP